MLSAWILSLLPWPTINSVSEKYRTNPKLIAAIILQESNVNECATRYESHYRWLYRPEFFAKKNNTTEETETIHQKTSWGLMQIMGAVARELGFDSDMVKLCDPAINIRFGVMHLAKLKKRYGSNYNDLISSYNAGSPRKNSSGKYVNQYYVDRVNYFLGEL